MVKGHGPMNGHDMLRLDDRAPPFSLLAREAMSFGPLRIRAALGPRVKMQTQGGGRPVMVIPGFMASDRTTARLRRSLSASGFACVGWGLGRNTGIKSDILERLDDQIASLGSSEPVTLIGWSLGGLIAREYAKHAPDRVAKIVTMGSPFSGNPRTNNAWRMYEFIAGHKVDAPPLDVSLSVKPPVLTVALWSRRDGLVSPRAACGLPHEADVRIEQDCSHMGYIASPDIIRRIAEIIAH
jgi:pimeloyl-ACP methyl ester carboxylesterase